MAKIRQRAKRKALTVYSIPERGVFEVKRGAGQSVYSFEYVYKASVALAAWLADNGGAAYSVLTSDMGTVAGFKKYLDIRAAVEWHCMTRAADCDALLHGELVLFEGMAAAVDMGGRTWRGVITRQGRGVLFHRLVKAGNKTGAIVRPWDVTGYKIE
jgi:hypothetical protein